MVSCDLMWFYMLEYGQFMLNPPGSGSYLKSMAAGWHFGRTFCWVAWVEHILLDFGRHRCKLQHI